MEKKKNIEYNKIVEASKKLFDYDDEEIIQHLIEEAENALRHFDLEVVKEKSVIQSEMQQILGATVIKGVNIPKEWTSKDAERASNIVSLYLDLVDHPDDEEDFKTADLLKEAEEYKEIYGNGGDDSVFDYNGTYVISILDAIAYILEQEEKEVKQNGNI